MEKATIGIGRQKKTLVACIWTGSEQHAIAPIRRYVLLFVSPPPRSVQTPLEPIEPRLADSRLTPPAREIVRDYWRVPESYHHLRGYYDLRCVFLYGLWELVKGLSNGFNSLPSLSPTLIAPGNSNPSQGRLVYAQKHLDTTVHGRRTAGWYFLVHTSQPFAFTELATSIP
ncbi:uncharacterized protein BO96DRAFT_421164 [Aspergillus niger CBS 101883]|uniref:uncharacterized protein n=1 Tax=Aspergillus lacticoffeatus (strain CBS 101883) TaxID=1450533 RepID=UPI000D7EE259|nr:uncharacterized protein BO96DRAFT_421164 [Aspergillus niger CBS 101883]PYH58394.1 hypothetical protein BO96DRAFT_421164 [Aspergillus niger CBS 101883]